MTLNSEGLEKTWRFDIQHGPEGEASFAWVYAGKDLVATMRTHHAESVVEAMNRRATPPVDGLEVVAELNRIIAEEAADFADAAGHAVEAGERPDLWDREVEVSVHTLSQASSVIAGLERHNQALLDKVGSEDCACAYDGPDDVCLGHSPKLEAAEARISSLEEQNKRLRAVVSASAAALCNGAAISTQASIEFMELLPVEIGKFCDRLERDVERLQRKLDLFEATVSFTRRWAIEKEGNGTSAEERLSAIANHPGVKGFQTEDHND